MNIKYDKEVDAFYIRIVESEVHYTTEIEEGTNLDFAVDNTLIGIEILNALKRYSSKDLFTLLADSPKYDIIINRN